MSPSARHQPPPVLETQRLRIRPFTYNDDAFILTLLNDADFIKHIQDRGIRNLEDARDYLTNGPLAGYEKSGIGLCCVIEKASEEKVGMCGLLKRATLSEPDIGYAFLPHARGKGFAFESAKEVIRFARQTLRLPRVLAVTNDSNTSSQRLLEKLGFSFLRRAQYEPNSEEIPCYAIQFDQARHNFE